MKNHKKLVAFVIAFVLNSVAFRSSMAVTDQAVDLAVSRSLFGKTLPGGLTISTSIEVLPIPEAEQNQRHDFLTTVTVRHGTDETILWKKTAHSEPLDGPWPVLDVGDVVLGDAFRRCGDLGHRSDDDDRCKRSGDEFLHGVISQ